MDSIVVDLVHLFPEKKPLHSSVPVLSHVFVQRHFSSHSCTTHCTRVREAVWEMLALNVVLHIVFGFMRKSMAKAAGSAIFCCDDVLSEVIWRLKS